MCDTPHLDLCDTTHLDMCDTPHLDMCDTPHLDLCDTPHLDLCDTPHLDLCDTPHLDMCDTPHLVAQSARVVVRALLYYSSTSALLCTSQKSFVCMSRVVCMCDMTYSVARVPLYFAAHSCVSHRLFIREAELN